MQGFSEDSKSRIRSIAESLIRDGEAMLGMLEGSRVKKEAKTQDAETDDDKPKSGKASMMLAFIKKKK